MTQEELASEQEVLDCFSTLKDIKSDLARVAYLNELIQRKTRGPVPMIAAAESRQITTYNQELKHLRTNIKHSLRQLVIRQDIAHP